MKTIPSFSIPFSFIVFEVLLQGLFARVTSVYLTQRPVEVKDHTP